MGNCMMKTIRSRWEQQLEEDEIEEIREAAAASAKATEYDKENEVGKGGSIKVKIVLTKEELELFLVKLKNNNGSNGGKRLQDLLAEMEKARSGKVYQYSWRPSLEGIMEDDDDDVDVEEGLENGQQIMNS